ncbi:MAG: 2Fe-2S iron-sulfur cluster binding domain-containing protein [Hyphomicrobiaceae bacterium]
MARRVIETPSGDVCSFYLVPADGQPLASYRPGQFVTFEFTIPGGGDTIIRSYSLSETPTNPQNYYRITVKKLLAPNGAPPGTPSGQSSTFFLEQLGEGSIIEASTPTGNFALDQESQRPVVLIGGGSGITPLISMLNWLVATKSERDVWFFQGARNRHEHAFCDQLKQINRTFPNVHLVVFYSQPSPTCRKGFDYDFVGRVTVDSIRSFLSARDCEFYICGPVDMIPSVTSDLHAWGVPKESIFSESFGGTLSRPKTRIVEPTVSAQRDLTSSGIRVHFARSGRKVGWSGRQSSLLELVEACGVPARYGCRSGQCGTCKTRIRSGAVEYSSPPGIQVDADSCLLCIAEPKTDVVLDL